MVKTKDQKEKLKVEDPKQTETKEVKEIKPERESDKFIDEERREILKIVKADVEFAEKIQADYIIQKELDLKHYHGAKPSELEGLTKKAWQSDRNLGLARAIADSYQSTLLATCWTPDTINLVATLALSTDNRVNQEKFIKWGMGKHEANVNPEVDGFIHNRIIVGGSFFKIYRKEWEEWVDKRIPVKDKKGDTFRFDIKTEKVKMVKGVIENIPDIDDILLPQYGKNLQELPFFIQILHLDGETVLSYIDSKKFIVSNKEEYNKKLYNHAYKEKERVIGKEKLENLGVSSETMVDADIRRLPIDLYEWYGYYTKNNQTEKYRFIVDLVNDEFLSGKPLRKINRSGNIPFTGGALAKEPGQLRGMSLMQIIAPIINAFNMVFNQKSDFQYVTNCPFGFYVPDEGYTKQKYELEPMVLYPVGGKPQDNVYIPNIQRSMAWAESDFRVLFEVLERLTGAASYFAIGQQRNKTLGQDMLVDKGSETRYSLWVSRIMQDIREAIGMWFELYQDYPPKGLAERVVGEDGKKLFPNLSINTLRGDTNVQMTPDVVAGSKAYRKQLQLWAFQAGQQTLWLNPQVNPSGNYELVSDTFKELLNLSDTEIERYLGPKPKAKFDAAELDNEWFKFMNGEDFEPPEGETMLAVQHLQGHLKQKEEKYHLLDDEYKPNFDAHLFKTIVNYMKFMRNVQQEAMANTIASRLIMANEGQMPNQPQNKAPMPSATPNNAVPGQPAIQPMQEEVNQVA